jgi:hypothetical protein
MKKIILSILLLSFCATFAFSQDYAVDKGSFWLTGMASFASQGGDLYKDAEDNRITTFSLAPNVSYFVARNVFIGAGITWTRTSQGDYSEHIFGIGPHVGYAFGNAESKVYPYIGAGFQFGSGGESWDGFDYKITGTQITIGAGVILPVKEHFAVVIEIGYIFHSMKGEDWDERESGNILAIGIGLAGFIF